MELSRLPDMMMSLFHAIEPVRSQKGVKIFLKVGDYFAHQLCRGVLGGHRVSSPWACPRSARGRPGSRDLASGLAPTSSHSSEYRSPRGGHTIETPAHTCQCHTRAMFGCENVSIYNAVYTNSSQKIILCSTKTQWHIYNVCVCANIHTQCTYTQT